MKTETKFTKGEWFYFKNNDRLKVATNQNYTNTTLAEVFAAEEDADGTDEANAKLIAAAPELLDALMQINGLIADVSNIENGKINLGELAKISINAIKKATK